MPSITIEALDFVVAPIGWYYFTVLLSVLIALHIMWFQTIVNMVLIGNLRSKSPYVMISGHQVCEIGWRRKGFKKVTQSELFHIRPLKFPDSDDECDDEELEDKNYQKKMRN